MGARSAVKPASDRTVASRVDESATSDTGTSRVGLGWCRRTVPGYSAPRSADFDHRGSFWADLGGPGGGGEILGDDDDLHRRGHALEPVEHVAGTARIEATEGVV